VKPNWKLFAAGWLLVLGGGGVARLVQTSGGVELRDVRIPMEGGEELSALLYVPPNATTESPAPGMLAVHGYINSRETQSGFAIEYARRGYVVLALDQTGHGFSGGRALGAGYGGPGGLAYLRGLPFVDPDRIGLEGHSMGGWASLAAAAAHPDGYRSVTLVGSATGPGFAPAGGPTFPRNLGVVFSTYDEFSQLMWGVQDARDVTGSAKLKTVFGVEDDVVPGRVYGSTEEGTARWLAMPVATHPGDHISRAAIGDALRWAEMTLASPTPTGSRALAPADQIWYWKELGTLVALLGGVLVLLGAFDVLMSRPWFSAARVDGVGAVTGPSTAWWLALAGSSLIPAATYFPFTGWGSAFAANAVFPQGITNQILVWAVGNGLIVALVLAARGRLRAPPTPDEGRVRTAEAGRAAVAAVLSVGVLYVAVLASHWLFRTDLRFWVVALKPLAPHHVPSFLAYVVPFTAFFYVAQKALHETLSLRRRGPLAQYATGLAATTGAFAVMTVALYAHLFAAGHLPTVGGVGALFAVIAIQFVAVLALTGIVAVYTWRRTNGTLAGALACGLLVTWYIVAGQATHV
jgi:pimeloyl-ACP methyl ester carboxylesterase